MNQGKSRSSAFLRVVRRWFFLLTGGYLLLCIVVFVFQRRLQYLPSPGDVPPPSAPRHAGIEDVTLRAADGTELRAWYWPGERDVTVVIFHGNAGNRRHRLEWIEGFHRRGLGVFLLDYRGYGGSGGSPTEKGLYLDGEAALRWLGEHDDAGKLILFGESLGGGVAVEMAARHDPAALILQSSFSSAADVARSVYFFLPVGTLMKDRFESIERIGDVECPLLFIHGALDSIIPLRLGKKLFEAAPEPKELYVLPEAGHNDLVLVGGRPYYERIDRFIRERVERMK